MTEPEPFTLAQMATPTSAANPDRPDDPAPTAVNPRRRRTVWIVALVVAQLALLAAAMLAGVMVAPYLSSPDSTFVVSREDAAIAACRKAVKEQLKAPATAQFIEEKTDDFNSYIEVTGAVDSQNSFGALLRNRFECHAVRQGDDWVGTQVTFSKA